MRAVIPDVAVRSAFIVGYPGEGEAEFQRLLEFIKAAQLDRAGAFVYSREPGTPAAELEPQVPAEVAEQRRHEVMALQQRISLARNRAWVGREMEVLIERHGERRTWEGRSFRDAPEIDGFVYVRATKPLKPGEFVTATITNAQAYDLVGKA